jgi:hypothetical protein
VDFVRNPQGKLMVFNRAKHCPMVIMVDGHRICPTGGCTGNGGLSLTPNARMDEIFIDEIISVFDVAAVEVYNRGGSIPASAPQPASDQACGVIEFWTGSRR